MAVITIPNSNFQRGRGGGKEYLGKGSQMKQQGKENNNQTSKSGSKNGGIVVNAGESDQPSPSSLAAAFLDKGLDLLLPLPDAALSDAHSPGNISLRHNPH